MIGFIKKLFGPSVDFLQLVMEKNAIIIDVRSPGEYRSGNIPGSKNYPVDSLNGKIKEIKALNKPVITVCQSGMRSAIAKGKLQQAGLEVYNGGPWSSLLRKLDK
ncbi:MAG: rhodanese-like domain-containing protein [Bacteroidetes bacterium]|nr:rhodanese-like domain-containing protein [Bacteroidota bacterium]